MLHIHQPADAGTTDVAPADEAGVVVETVERESAPETAGLRAGDILLSWERLPEPSANPQAARGELGSPFDWRWLAIEQAPRGQVKLTGLRQGEPRAWSVPPGVWQGRVRPAMSGRTLTLYLEGEKLVATESFRLGIETWLKLADLAENRDDRRLRCWIFQRSGEAWEKAGEWAAAQAAYQQALGEAREPVSRAAVSGSIARLHEKRGDSDAALVSYHATLESPEAPRGLSLLTAGVHYEIGKIAWRLGRLAVAEEHSRRALEIQQEMAPDSLEVARSLINLGVVAQMRGELGNAESIYRQAQAISTRLAPNSQIASNVLNNMAILHGIRGDVATAAAYCREALEINEKIAPASLRVASNLINLGIATMNQGDFELAADYLERALRIYENRAPGDVNVVSALVGLGEVALKQGRLEVAKKHLDQAREIRQRQAPESLEVAELSVMLGTVARLRSRPEHAAKHYERALAIRESLAPGSLEMADSLFHLGVLAHGQGDWDLARDRYAGALQIQQELAPGTLNEAKSLRALGELSRRSGHLEAAVAYWQRSIDALEAQAGKLASSQEVKGSFRSLYRGHYLDLVELLVEMRRPEEAFAVLERSRARSFLTLLAERDLILAADLPADLERERKNLTVLYDRTQRQLAALSPLRDKRQVEQLAGRLRELRRQRQEIIAKVRKTSPKLAAVRYPQPLRLVQARNALDPGTVMLSYSVGEARTNLFVVARSEESAGVATLDVGEEELRRQVERFRQLVLEAIPGTDLGASRLADLEEAGRSLYRLLIEPVAAALEDSERLLIVPDGPLHLLPFAALIRETADHDADRARRWQYLVEWKPLHSVLSSTVYAELKNSRRPPLAAGSEPPLLVAFGDPRYPDSLRRNEGAASIADVRPRSAVRRGHFDWQPLPYSRREIGEIAGLHGNSRAFLGEMATEERAKSIDTAARLVHFATHSHVDTRFPLNSALVLAMPEGFPEDRDNGLLQAWEIFESVRLDADLVTLSACQSALGEERGGEGLIGLTRAFQYAGARSVAATLWSVADRTTPELMVRFYHQLRSGKSKDQALQAAQVELIRGPIEVVERDGERATVDASAPYYWAAFQIVGDWL